jgi:hypothetical protein
LKREVRIFINPGLESQGIYRISGNAATMARIKLEINKGILLHIVGNFTDINNDYTDINAISGLFKLFFRELLDPVIPFEFYDRFIAAIRKTPLILELEEYNERLTLIKDLVQEIPKEHYAVLECVIRHLAKVATHSNINKMEPSNLAIVFGFLVLIVLDLRC